MGKTPDNSNNDLDLSNLNFGPSWARDEPKKVVHSKHKETGRSGRDTRKGGLENGHNRQGSRDQRQRNNRDDRGKGGAPHRDQYREERRPRFEPTPIPEGFSGEIMPIEDGLDRLAKQILQTARTYSVFDLARMVLESRDRFNVGLKAPKGQKIFRNIVTFATYLTKEEALADFWKSEVKAKFYKEVKKEIDAPAGNFPSVAKCSKSGLYLGPPNHHSYQTKLRELHNDRFPSVPFEVYQRGIDILKGEEEVAKWIEQEKYQTYYLPLSLTPDPTQSEAISEGNSADSISVEKESEVNIETADEEEIDDTKLLKSRLELERHFSVNYFDQAYKQVQISWVPSSISAKMLSPGLLSLLKDTITQERRYPGKLSSLMCRQLSGRNVAVFKLNKKLKAGPSRPHALPDLSTLAERPKAIMNWAKSNDGIGVDELWKAVLPENVEEQEKSEWFHDFKWLLSQGYLSLLEGGQVFISKKEATAEAQKGKGSSKKKEKFQKNASKDKVVNNLEKVTPEASISDSDIVYLQLNDKIDTIANYSRAREKKLLTQASDKKREQRRGKNIEMVVSAREIRGI